ncbi:MAG TPA: SPOR domain-containing protein [Bryobacteraceae bacterium]|nr:SPOR domain-containing protein [Bryobacteraceae bacterium]
MSAPWQFSITKSRMVQLGLCLGAIQVLLFTSGVATGLLIGPRTARAPEVLRARLAVLSASAAAKDAVAKPAAMEARPQSTTAHDSAPPPPGNAAGAQPALAPSAEAAVNSAPAQAMPSQEAAPQSAASQPTAVQSEQGPGVAIQVASFHMKNNAMRLADILKRQGYGPVLVGESTPNGVDTWHFVQLGPYKEWDEASRIVAELDRSYEVHAYVRPIRGLTN